jgi:hypothetical protein
MHECFRWVSGLLLCAAEGLDRPIIRERGLLGWGRQEVVHGCLPRATGDWRVTRVGSVLGQDISTL